MKKILIGLLLVAAATAAYFFLYKKNDTEPVKKATNQELLIGKWKTNSVHSVTDSLQTQYSYDFQKEGNAFRSISDSARADTLFYEWNKTGELLLRTSAADTIAKTYTVAFTGGDSLTLKADSINIQLIKQK
ncbi:MAG: hypothetical protein IPH18_01595 [Chitinophagaceae bacterium]|nr:hypothetical protein [Chitinophagaceae bacterium]